MQSALDYLVIYSGRNDQCDIEVTSLAKLLPYSLGVNQPRDHYKCWPDRTEPARDHSSVVNGQADPQPGSAIPREVGLGDRRSQLTGVVGNQRQPVYTLRQHSEFPVPAWLAIPEFAIQACSRRCLRHRILEVVLDSCLLCCIALAESLDVYRYEKPERQASEIQRMCLSSGWDA